MRIKKNVPMMTTNKIDAEKAFYGDHLGFRPTVDTGNYLGLASRDGTCEIAFMRPMGGEAVTDENASLSFCLEVDDVDGEFERLEGEGVTFAQPPKDNPWGDRSAIAVDPIGISVYIYKMIPPSPEYAKYFKE